MSDIQNVLIVEDDPIARKLFEMYISEEETFCLSGSVESAAMAYGYCTANKTDLILMDICTAGHSSGLAEAVRIKESFPEIRIVLVTSQPEVGFIERAKEGNIDSFWYKITDENELKDVLIRTSKGERIYPTKRPHVKIGEITDENFSEQELAILRELTSGDTNKQIAERLHLSPRTIENNIQRMLEKTGFGSRTSLACAAVESGIVIRDV